MATILENKISIQLRNQQRAVIAINAVSDELDGAEQPEAIYFNIKWVVDEYKHSLEEEK